MEQRSGSRMRVACGAIVAVVMALAPSAIATLKGQAQAQASEVLADFTAPLSIDSLDRLVQESGVKPLELRFEVEIDGSTHSGGVVIQDDDSVRTAFERMAARQAEFLEEALVNTEDDIARRSETAQASSTLHAELDELRKQLRGGELRVSGIRTKNDQNLSKLLNSGQFRKVVVAPSARTAQQITPQKLTPQGVGGKSWTPSRGSSKVTQYMAFNIMYWSANNFASDATYEQESQIYSTRFASPDGTWTSNLPNAYLDTPFLDTIFNPTIGTSRASKIGKDTQYYASIGLRPGTEKTAKVIIKGQRGVRWPSFCDSTWCIFASETSSAFVTFTAPISLQKSW